MKKTLDNWLFKGKAIVLTGARQVGKTTLLQSFLPDDENLLWIDADDTHERQRLEEHTKAALRSVVGNYKVIIIDEVQRIKNSGILLKLLVDNFKQVQVIATGSSTIDISDTIFEPLTGRHLLFHLYPFSLAELYPGQSDFQVEQQLPFHLVYGTYPDVCMRKSDAEIILKNLANQYLYKDVLAWKNIKKPDLLDKLLKLISYQVGQLVSIHELANLLHVSSETIENYLSLLEKSFIVYRLHSYSNNARKEITKMCKIYFWDNGIRNAVIGRYESLQERNDQGQLWENLMVSERIKMNTWMQTKASSHFWRSYNQSEVDYVEVAGKKVAGFEMKWSKRPKGTVSVAFTNQYPKATGEIIHPRNFTSFCMLNRK